ncbi:hypothetical protein BJ742DRAFT_104320 [Cladochytrium replicatum]|nr:hypothetical protein BJ742DRAFT_104320 [Cladochytrium replicatum]
MTVHQRTTTADCYVDCEFSALPGTNEKEPEQHDAIAAMLSGSPCATQPSVLSPLFFAPANTGNDLSFSALKSHHPMQAQLCHPVVSQSGLHSLGAYGSYGTSVLRPVLPTQYGYTHGIMHPLSCPTTSYIRTEPHLLNSSTPMLRSHSDSVIFSSGGSKSSSRALSFTELPPLGDLNIASPLPLSDDPTLTGGNWLSFGMECSDDFSGSPKEISETTPDNSDTRTSTEPSPRIPPLDLDPLVPVAANGCAFYPMHHTEYLSTVNAPIISSGGEYYIAPIHFLPPTYSPYPYGCETQLIGASPVLSGSVGRSQRILLTESMSVPALLGEDPNAPSRKSSSPVMDEKDDDTDQSNSQASTVSHKRGKVSLRRKRGVKPPFPIDTSVSLHHLSSSSGVTPGTGASPRTACSQSTPGSAYPPQSARGSVRVACVNCKKSCKKCMDERPCPRCIRLKIEETCVDAPRKDRNIRKTVSSRDMQNSTGSDYEGSSGSSGIPVGNSITHSHMPALERQPKSAMSPLGSLINPPHQH